MTADVEPLPCGQCGMPCRAGEYHPFAACLMFKACHNSETVRANLAPLQAEIEALRAEVEFLRRGIVPRDDDMIVPVKLLDEINASGAEWKDRAERLAEALRLALNSHGKTLLTDPPQDAWKVNRVEEIGRALLREQEEGNGQ